MRGKSRKISVLYQFMMTYFGAILVAVGIIAVILVGAAANGISSMEISTMKSALSLFAADMQAQCEMFEGAYKRVLTSASYRPSILKENKYNEIELLEDFSNFSYYSSVSQNVYLLYAGETMVYHSGGHKVDLPLYCVTNYGVDRASAEGLCKTLAQTKGFQLLDMSDLGGKPYLLFVYAIKFPGGVVQSDAVMTFEVNKADLSARLEMVSGYPFENYALLYQNMCILEKGTMEDVAALQDVKPREVLYQKANNGQWHLASRTENGMFSVYATGKWDAFAATIHAYRWQIAGFSMIAIILFLLMAFLLAVRSSKPIRQLAVRYGQPGGEKDYNEFYQLENAILMLEKECDNSVSTARQQLLLMILRGNCNMEVLKRWADFGISMEHANHCVFVMDIRGWTDQRNQTMLKEIESLSDEDIRLYALLEQKKNCIAILGSFRYGHLQGEIMDYLNALMDETGDDQRVFCGETYDTPLKLTSSYSEALSAFRAMGEMPTSTDVWYAKVDGLIEETQLAITAGDVDCVASRLSALAQLTENSADAQWLHKYVSHKLLAQFSRYAQEKGQTISAGRISKLLLLQDFSVFIHDYLAMVGEVLPLQDDAPQSTTRGILKYIDKNVYDCDFSLDTIADAFSLSADYISRLVRGATGIPFKEYIISLRMAHARKLLIQWPNLTVNDISMQSGYRTPSNFIKKFRETTGVTPLQYRKMPMLPTERPKGTQSP